MIDSTAIQETVGILTNTGLNFLPEHLRLLAPALSALITAITAAFIRYFEKRKIEGTYKAALERETELLNKRMEQIKKENHL